MAEEDVEAFLTLMRNLAASSTELCVLRDLREEKKRRARLEAEESLAAEAREREEVS